MYRGRQVSETKNGGNDAAPHHDVGDAETRAASRQKEENSRARWRSFPCFFLFVCSICAFAVSFIVGFWSNFTKNRYPSHATKVGPFFGVFGRPKESVHVVIVGGGLAGISAALEARAYGCQVTLLDKESRLGGNSAKATSGINGVRTDAQRQTGIQDDSVSLFVKDVVASGHETLLNASSVSENQRTALVLIRALGARSAEAVKFLEKFLPSKLSHIVPLGGHSVPRTHRFPPDPQGSPLPIGFLTIAALSRELTEANVTIKLKTKLVDLVFDETVSPRLISGVKVISTETFSDAEPLLLNADAVVLAAGGFGADVAPGGLVAKWLPDVPLRLPFTTNGPFATGDLLKLALRYDLDTVGLSDIQLHPTSFVDPADPGKKEKFLCPEAVRGFGAILLDSTGKRFVNELAPRDVVTAAILTHGKPASQWPMMTQNKMMENSVEPTAVLLLMNQNIRNKLGPPVFDFYLKRGFIRHFGALSEAERKFKLPYLKQTLEAYNASAKADASDTERNDPFGRRHFDTVFHPLDVYYTSFITPASHYTMGGIRINAEAQVISRDFLPRVPVPNLFAAGEVAGGLHGKNRLGGNGMLESVVYGRIAGYNAARVASLELLNASLSGSSSERPMSLIVRSVEPLETRQHGGAGQAYDQGTFWKLTLSLRSLAQTSGLPLHASSLRYRASIVERRHHLHDTELTGTVIVMTPPSTIGYVSILLPPVGPTSLLRHLLPGDSIEVFAEKGREQARTTLVLRCDPEDNTIELALHPASTSISVAARLAYEELVPAARWKIYLVIEEGDIFNATSLKLYLNSLGLNVSMMSPDAFALLEQKENAIFPATLTDVATAASHCR